MVVAPTLYVPDWAKVVYVVGAIVITWVELLTLTTGDVAMLVRIPVAVEAVDVVNVEVVGDEGATAVKPPASVGVP